MDGNSQLQGPLSPSMIFATKISQNLSLAIQSLRCCQRNRTCQDRGPIIGRSSYIVSRNLRLGDFNPRYVEPLPDLSSDLLLVFRGFVVVSLCLLLHSGRELTFIVSPRTGKMVTSSCPAGHRNNSKLYSSNIKSLLSETNIV